MPPPMPAPQGFSSGLFDCCSDGCSCWAAMCCAPTVVAQLTQRITRKQGVCIVIALVLWSCMAVQVLLCALSVHTVAHARVRPVRARASLSQWPPSRPGGRAANRSIHRAALRAGGPLRSAGVRLHCRRGRADHVDPHLLPPAHRPRALRHPCRDVLVLRRLARGFFPLVLLRLLRAGTGTRGACREAPPVLAAAEEAQLTPLAGVGSRSGRSCVTRASRVAATTSWLRRASPSWCEVQWTTASVCASHAACGRACKQQSPTGVGGAAERSHIRAPKLRQALCHRRSHTTHAPARSETDHSNRLA
jgi:hypothetical protein